jgi:hypothetical protein
MFRSNESLETSQSMKARIDFVLKGATNQVDWREGMVVDLVGNIDPTPSGRSTVFAKREC